MGRTQTAGATLPGAERAQRDRFAKYFPRAFAYAHSSTGSDARSREIVIEAFASVFSEGDVLSDEEFPIALFNRMRGLCEKFSDDSDDVRGVLTDGEREVLALLFDAQLTRLQVGGVLQIREDTVASTLVQGLKKIRQVFSSDMNPSLQDL